MEYLKVADQGPKREYFRSPSRARNQKAVVNNILDAIARVKGTGEVIRHTDEDGAVRMKILVKKEDLKQVLEVMRDGKSNIISPQSSSVSSKPSSCSMSLEQRLIFMRKRQLSRASHIRIRQHRSSWMPALQSIPEEL